MSDEMARSVLPMSLLYVPTASDSLLPPPVRSSPFLPHSSSTHSSSTHSHFSSFRPHPGRFSNLLRAFLTSEATCGKAASRSSPGPSFHWPTSLLPHATWSGGSRWRCWPGGRRTSLTFIRARSSAMYVVLRCYGVTALQCYGVMLLGEREESRDRDGERYNCEREREKRTETETERDTTVNVRL